MNVEILAVFAIAHSLLEHDEDVSAKLFLVRISQTAFG
jgi:hypothetical protein